MSYTIWMVWATGFLLVFSKFLDCLTTSIRINHVNQEKNKIARALMKNFGIKRVVWFVFLFTLLIVSITLYLLFTSFYTKLNMAMFIVTGMLLSLIQFAVAHQNYTLRPNFITKLLLKIRLYG